MSKKNKCMDNGGYLFGDLYMAQCTGQGGHQSFGFTKDRQIATDEENCIGIDQQKSLVKTVECSTRDLAQIWQYDREVNFYIRFLNNTLNKSKAVFNQKNIFFSKCFSSIFKVGFVCRAPTRKWC